ncbi:MAG TPA: NAD(P)/FAD-dependent oxidoreductase [Candidatus Limnocylindrales bacterium]|nr:NAD(P)/FAD-dependent oxidoreductase [Candidatus Limnocylindrales bacterium]
MAIEPSDAAPEAGPAHAGDLAAPTPGGWFDTESTSVVPFDVAVIGAGPAGLAAAGAAVAAGVRVALVDAAPRPGGQYWRHRPGDDGRAHHAWPEFVRLRDAVEAAVAAGTLVRLARHAVWHVERGSEAFTIHAVVDGAPHEVRARTLVVATGAFDRQVPFPGWTLPGVYTAGAAQALLKGNGVLVGRRVAVGGTGPFLLPVAAGLAAAGATVVGVFEAGRPAAFARHPLTTLRNPAKLREGAGYLRVLRRHGVPYRTRTAIVAATGEREVTGVRVASLDAGWRPVDGTERTLEVDAVAVGYGFTPQTEIPVQLGCEMALDGDGSLVARVDDAQASSVPGVYVAGEACGVGGSALAVAEGEIAGSHAAASASGRPPDAATLRSPRSRRASGRAFARALQQAFPVPSGWQGWLTPETVVCRCEEVSAGRIDEVVAELGAADPRSVKLLARPGMGLCQGRVCGYAVACLVASRAGRTVTAGDLAGTAARPIAMPVPLSVLAASPTVPPDEA